MEARPLPTPDLPTQTQGDMVSPTVRTPIRTILGAIDAHDKKRVIVGGWVRTGRKSSSALAFLELNDGSCQQNLQAVVKGEVYELLRRLTPTGTSVFLEGVLEALDGAKHKQLIELKVERVIDVGEADARFYPLPKTKHSLEGLGEITHLRPRTDTIAAVARIRSELAFATYIFFRDRGFWQVHTPVISTSDCEGAGEMFQVTTLFSQAEKVEKELQEKAPPSEADIQAAKLVAQEKADAIAQLKAAKATKQEIRAAVLDLEKAKENVSSLEAERLRLTPGIPREEDGTISFESDFFKRPAFLTVSGQLQAETYASALGNVYTFGPTFRAENSHTSRHLAEFWMVEPEMAFADLEDDMNCAESSVQHLCKWILEHCRQEMEFMVKHSGDGNAIERLELVSASPFERITYTKAVEILENADKEFENKVEWGIDLSSEHERIIDGGLSLGQYEWYLDLRRFGSVKHSGFGMGFERMLLFATGLDNIRDVIPFPRSPGKADL